MSDDVLVETSGPVVTLRLNRPTKHNAITEPISLLRGIRTCRRSGPAFTAGNDPTGMKANPPDGVRALAARSAMLSTYGTRREAVALASYETLRLKRPGCSDFVNRRVLPG